MERVIFMAYFLKKSNLKKGIYLQIYESFYDPQRGHTAHKSYKALGYVDQLIASGIADPISFFKKEVDELNQKRKTELNLEKDLQISDGQTPEKFLGYFPVKSINDSLGAKKYIDLMQTSAGFQFNIFSMISALIYARIVCPCSKRKTFEDVLPKLFEKYDFSLSQIYEGIEYIGCEYEKIIEIYNHRVHQFWGYDTNLTYFDCTNFFFEIDREDSLRKKGPSKENRKDPIVGMGLLLDADQIPVGMKIYPGNESERPVIRNIIHELKQRNNISGRTIQVADKGLNCAENIVSALQSGDGYIFSKSVKQLPETEKLWVLLDNDYRDVKDKKGNVLYRIKECIDDFLYQIVDKNGKKKTVMLKEKRVVTFNPKLAKKQKLEIDRQIEKAKILKAGQAKKSEYGDSSKYVTFIAADQEGEKTDGKVKVEMNEQKIQKDRELAGYNLLVTSEIKMAAAEIYSTYHNLWRIEESFRVMKSQLDARPVYLQKENAITGHFLICYLAVLLTRIFQFKILKNKYSSEEIFDFMKHFKVVKLSERKYINLMKNSCFIKEFTALTNLPITSYFLSNLQIKNMLSYRF